MRLTRATGPVLGLSLVMLVGACGDESSDADPESSTDTSASESPETSKPVDPIDFGTEPKLRPRYKKAALRATDDDLITMVPTTLPDGWETLGGGYQRDPQWWHMEFTAPSGDVTLDQMPGTAEEVLTDQDLEAGDAVDLSDWGTGEWSAWDHRGATVLTYDLKGSTVVLQGPDVETVRGLAESLLPAEDAAEQDG
ncbi:MAG TPA: hypothetical protein VGD39_13900 [Nocardioides sp.]